ncbi:MAG: DUF2809 domain-containing protein [Brasilonema sp.]
MLSKVTQSFSTIPSLLIVIAMGFFFKYYTGPAHEWFNDYGAAVFYEIFWCLFAFVLFKSRAAVRRIPPLVFIITCILEFLQLWHPPLLEEFRTTLIGKWLIGSTFSWWDFPHYVLGCVLGWLWLHQLHGKGYAKKS